MQSTFTLRNITMTECEEIAPGLFTGRDNQGHLRVFDGEYFRGYATPWATPKKPDGWQVRTWSAGHSESFKRLRLSRRGAERILLREALRIQREIGQ